MEEVLYEQSHVLQSENSRTFCELPNRPIRSSDFDRKFDLRAPGCEKKSARIIIMSLYNMHRSAGRPWQETDFIQLKLQVLSSSNSACVHSPLAPSTCCFTHSGFYDNRVSPTLFQSGEAVIVGLHKQCTLIVGFSTRQTERLRIEAAQYRVKKKIKVRFKVTA